MPTAPQAAVRARDQLRQLVEGQMVCLHNVRLEKYGRVLAGVTFRGADLSKWMLERNLAVPYDGGTKPAVDWTAVTRA